MSLRIKGVTFGNGTPRICVPITGKSKAEIIRQSRMTAESHPDLVEWRSDFYEDVLEGDSAMQMLKILSDIFPEIPLIFTFRSAGEGGNKEISNKAYKELCTAAAEQDHADLIDLEVYREGLDACDLISRIHHLNGKVVASNHNFHLTYETDEMVKILSGMDEMGADMLKLAMMPRNAEDVLRLLQATLQESKKTTKPVVTMSMDKLGKISRIGGGIFGSAITFASAAGISAPGQIPIDEMRNMILQVYDT